MDPAHLNKLFSISNWLFLIPCYCQNSIGDLWNTLVPTFRSSSSDSFLQMHFFRRISSDPFFQTLLASNKIPLLLNLFNRIFMSSTLIMDLVHLNKLFSISNWWFLIPCYYQNLRGDLEKHPLFQQFGGNQSGKIIGTRTIGNASFSINNVWLVDGLKHNLVSISQFCDNGYDVLFDKTSCTVVNKSDNSIIFKGKRMDIVYKINFSNWLIRR